MTIPQEQPPLDTPRDLTEWLARQQIAINIELNKSSDFEVLYVRPDKEFNGMVRLFGAAIDATITSSGLWIYKNDAWDKILTHSDIPVFDAYMSADQTGITSSTWTTVDFDTEDADTHSFYNTSNNKFSPDIAGYYQINLALLCEAVTMTAAYASILKNGTTRTDVDGWRGSSSVSVMVGGSVMVYLDGVNDYIQPEGYIIGASLNKFIGITRVRFSGHLIRRV